MVDRADEVVSTLARLGAAVHVSPHDLTVQLSELSVVVGHTVGSFAGLHLTTVISSCPITFVRFATVVGPDAIGTSVRVPLSASEPGSSAAAAVSTVARFFAHIPGAFVDLAADLTIALGLAPSITGPSPGAGDPPAATDGTITDHGSCIHLDADLPPSSTTTDVIGLAAFDTVNQAIGVLIDEGRTDEEAVDELGRRAVAAGVDLAATAGRIVADVRDR